MAHAFVSLATNDMYAKGAYVLGKSLKNTNTTKQLVLMLTNGVSHVEKNRLQQVWDKIVDITQMNSNDLVNLSQLKRPELGCTFSKLHAWMLTDYEKCVFMDADTMVLQNVDDMFQREELSAAPDIGWPDCFNSGVFVFKPSQQTFTALLNHAEKFGSFDGGDQGLLNEFFSDWSTADISRHLPFTYNTVSASAYSYTPAFKRFGKDIKIVHFLGALKPWTRAVNRETGKVVQLTASNIQTSEEIFTQMWWDLYVQVDDETSIESWKHWEEAGSHAQKQHDRKKDWEEGRPDYQGEDRFDNILTYMSAMMLENKPDNSTK